MNGHVSSCSNDVVRKIKQELEDWFVGGEKFQANQMLSQVQKIQGKMHDMIQALKNGDDTEVANKNGESAPSMEVGRGNNKRRVYYWGGRFHSVPIGFKVPKITLASLITCWYCGNSRDDIPSLCFVQGHDLAQKNWKGFGLPMEENDNLRKNCHKESGIYDAK